ncbi:helix-turn-helix domain-containing protein [Paenibacillus sp. 1P07SE]|uniref:AraC family transcriptional regulator n=1 Tax=Paenibacillus sp. 1P07SE TaxID=3132209 RepID=UPI0039A5D779
MNEVTRFRWRGIWSRWLASYVVVLLIPILIMAATHLQTRKVMEEEISRANAALLSQLQQEIDNYVDFTYRLSEVISFSPRVNALIRGQQEVTAAERISISQLLAELKAYNISRRYVDNFYIYFRDRDFVLTESSYYETGLFFQHHVLSRGIAYDAWQSFLMKPQRGAFGSLRMLGEEEGIVYARTLPLTQNSTSSATLVIELNEAQLFASLRTIQSYNQGHVYILDADNTVLTSSEGKAALSRSFELPAAEREQVNTASADWAGEEVTLSYIESERNSWKYVYAIPERLYSEKAEHVRNMTFLMLLVALVIGAVIAVLFARRNYSPLQKLVRSVVARSDGNLGGLESSDEYAYLEEAMDSALDRYQLMNRTIEKQNKTLRSHLLARFLKGRIAAGFPAGDVLPEYGIRPDASNYAVILFYLEDYSGFFRQGEQGPEERREMVHLIMTNIVEELVCERHQGWMTEVDEMLACIVNFEPGTTSAAAVHELGRIIQEAQRFIGSRFHIQFTVSVSGVHESMEGLPAAYQEAMEAMAYRILQGEQTIIWHDQVGEQKLSYDYPLEKEQQLLNYVGAGDYEGASQLLDGVIDRNLAEENLSVDMIRCLLFDMCSTMMKAAMESNPDRVELYSDNLEAIRELMNGSTVSAMRTRMKQFLQKVCELAGERVKASRSNRLKEQVLAYIADHYREHDLNIGAIAEHHSVHPSYLSRYFKEQVGDNLTEYLNKYRVERSKALLLEQDKYVKDIGEEVGFYSISTYIRLFKKYEGVTPSAYRDSKRV